MNEPHQSGNGHFHLRFLSLLFTTWAVSTVYGRVKTVLWRETILLTFGRTDDVNARPLRATFDYNYYYNRNRKRPRGRRRRRRRPARCARVNIRIILLRNTFPNDDDDDVSLGGRVKRVRFFFSFFVYFLLSFIFYFLPVDLCTAAVGHNNILLLLRCLRFCNRVFLRARTYAGTRLSGYGLTA